MSGGNFLTIAICARFLPLEEQGKFTYAFACYLALLLLNISAIFQGATVRAPTESNKEKYLSVLAGAQILIALKFAISISLLFWFFGQFIGWQPTAVEFWLLMIFLLLQQLADFDRRISFIFFNSRRAMFSSASIYPLRLLLIVFLRPDNINTLLILLIISALLPAFITLKRGTTGILSKENLSGMRDHFGFSKLLVASAVLGWLWSYVPIFFLGAMYSRKEVAIVASIRSLTNIANILMEQLETVGAAKFGQILHDEGKAGLDKISRKLLLFGNILWFIGFIIISLFGKTIVWFVLGEKYAEYNFVLSISWIAYGVLFLARVFGLKQRLLKNLRVEFAGNVGGVLSVIIASYPVILFYDLYGAAWMYVLCAATMLVFQMAIVNTKTFKLKESSYCKAGEK